MKIRNNIELMATPTKGSHVANVDYVDGKMKTITWAEYEALTEEEKNNGTLYDIPDMPTAGIDSLTYSYAELFSGNISDWATTNYITIPITSAMQTQIDKGFPQVIYTQFGSGATTIGVASGNITSSGVVLGLNEWVMGMPIIDGKKLYIKKDDTNIYIWCDENPNLPLRYVSLVKNI